MSLQCLGALLREAAKDSGNGITFIEDLEQELFLSYKALYKKSSAFLYGIQQIGIKPGDHIIFQVDNNYDFIIAFWACMLGGICPVPVTTVSSEDLCLKLKHIIHDLDTPYLLVSTRIQDYLSKSKFNWESVNIIRVDDIATDNDRRGREYDSKPEDLCFIQYSSGSTNQSKGVMLEHGNLISNLNAIISGGKISKEDSSFSWMPLTHDMGLIGFHLAPMWLGLNQYLMPTTLFIRRPVLWMKKVHEHRVTILSSPNFGYKYFLDICSKELIASLDLSSVRLIFNGAEPISAALVYRFIDRLKSTGIKSHVIFPVYGLAEACLAVTFPPVEEEIKTIFVNRSSLEIGSKVIISEAESEDSTEFVDLGYPVEDVEIRIVDQNYSELDNGYIGHILIRGKNVTSGYYNNPEATEEALNNEGWLKTGDIGFIRNSRLTVTGRYKDIIFVNGMNFYSHDIEKTAEAVKGIELRKIVVIGVHNNKTQNEDIVVFLLYRKKIGEDFLNLSQKLREHLNKKLNIKINYIIPVHKIYTTTSGKVQRYKFRQNFINGSYDNILSELKQLQQLNGSQLVRADEEDVTIRKILYICREGLQNKDLTSRDNFFEIGVDSIALNRIIFALEQEFNTHLPYEVIYQNPSVYELSKVIATGTADVNKIEKAGNASSYPLTPQQKGIFLLNNMDRKSIAYNITYLLKLNGNIDKVTLEACFTKLIQRHITLRTYFELNEDEPVQKISKQIEFHITELRLRQSDTSEDVIRAFVQPFPLEKPPLFKVGLLSITKEEKIMIIDTHHLIADGTSLSLLVDEFICLLKNEALSDIKYDYQDYAFWLQENRHRQAYKLQKEYWRNKFTIIPPSLPLPLDFKRPKIQTFEGESIYFDLSVEWSQCLKEIASANKSTLYMVLLSLYNIFLYKYTLQKDFVVGTVFSGRNYKEWELVQGMFVNTIPIRTKVENALTYTGYLRTVKESVIGALQNQDVPFEELVKELHLVREINRNPLFDTMFLIQDMDMEAKEWNGLKIESYQHNNPISKFDLTLIGMEQNKQIRFQLEYNTALFKKNTVMRMASHFHELIQIVTQTKGEVIIRNMSLLSDKELDIRLHSPKLYDTNCKNSDRVCTLFEQQVEQHSERIALVCGSQKINYESLNRKSNQLAAHLRRNGVTPGSGIVVYAERSIPLMVGILGILKSGAAFIPVDSKLPQSKVNYIIQNSNPQYILSTSEVMKARQSTAIDERWINLEEDVFLAEEAGNLPQINQPEDLAYILYTSGTTGNSKGVMISRESLGNYIMWASKNYVKSERVDFPLHSSISFDLTITSLFTPLVTGNCLYIYPGSSNDIVIQDVLDDNLVQVVKLTPSHLNIVKLNDNRGSNIKRLIVGGEKLRTTLAEEVYESFGGQVEIINEYGPTEATVGCMIYRYDPDFKLGDSVPIGVPADNVIIYVLDADGNPVPEGVLGEIYIGGSGVAKGYLGDTELTREKFIQDPLKCHYDANGALSRFYRTGDIAKYLTDEIIEYIGREDHQVKIRGHRVELGEIEHSLNNCDHIKDAIVLQEKDSKGEEILKAYLSTGKEVLLTELRAYLSTVLPFYMIPAKFYQLDTVPLTINGKIDVERLKQIAIELKPGEVYSSPSNEIQKMLIQVWQEVLSVEKIGIHDNFFELGGDSIKAVRVVAGMNNYSIRLNVKDVLINQTIASLSEQIDSNDRNNHYRQGFKTGTKKKMPMDNWFIQWMGQRPEHFNQSITLDLKKEIDISWLEKAFSYVIRHHDGLRLNYLKESKEIIFNQQHENLQFNITKLDFTHLSHAQKERVLARKGYDWKHSFNVSEDLLIKAMYIQWTETESKLVITAHHLLVDGISWRILLEDLYSCYTKLSQGVPPVLTLKTASLQDWTEGLEQYKLSDQYKDWLGQWTKLDESQFTIPVDYHTSQCTMKDQGYQRIVLNDNNHELLAEAGRKFRTNLLPFLVLALADTLRDWTGHQEVLMELESHGRHLPDVDSSKTIGWFTSLYPFPVSYVDEEKEQHISERILEIRERLNTYSENSIGYGLMKYGITTDEKDEKKLPQIRLNYLGSFNEMVHNDLFALSPADSGSDVGYENYITAKIVINCFTVGGQTYFQWEYSKKMYNEATILKWIGIFENYLTKMLFEIEQIKEESFHSENYDFTGLSKEELNFVLNSINKDNVEDLYPLSAIQEGMLYHYFNETGSTEYKEYLHLEMKGKIEEEGFRKAWQQVIKDYEMLRTVYRWEGLERPVQITLKQFEPDLRFYDLSQLNDSLKYNRLEDIKKQDFKETFLLKVPPYRILLCKLETDRSVLIFSNYHIITDGWSTGIILKEFIGHYNQWMRSQSFGFVAPKTKYKEFVKFLTHVPQEKHRAFWKEYLSNRKPDYLLKTGSGKLSDVSGEGKREYPMDRGVLIDLEALSRKSKVSLSVILYTAWGLLLKKYKDSEDVIFGTTVSGRSAGIPQVDRIVGLLINTIPLRINFAGNMKIEELLHAVQNNIQEREEYELDSLTDIGSYGGINQISNLFDSIVVIENYPLDRILYDNEGELSIEKYAIFELSNYDLTVSFNIFDSEHITLKIVYLSSKFQDSEIQKISEDYLDIIGQISRSRKKHIEEITLQSNLVSAKAKYKDSYDDFDF